MLKKLYALKNKKGFTLVELMVVVAILGILVAVAVPVYNNVTGDAKINACASNIRTIQSALMQAQIEGKAPTASDTDAGTAVAKLVADGYLQSAPVCPGDKTSKYKVTVDKNKLTVECTSADKDKHNAAVPKG